MKPFYNIRKKKSILPVCLFFMVYGIKVNAQVDATNTGIMYISNSTIVACEGAFTITAAGSTENAGDFYIKGNWTNDGSYVTNTGTATYWGTAAQTINGTSSTTFYDAEINKASNGVTLNTNVQVSHNLDLTNGPLDLNSKTLTITSPATTGIGYTNGYIISEDADNSSKVQWNMGSTTGAHVIPFATAGGVAIPLTLNLTSGTIGNVTSSTYPSAANNTPYPVTPDHVLHLHDVNGNDNSANTVDRFWQIDKTGASGTITAIFTYANAETPANGEANLRAQRYSTSANGWNAAVPLQTSDAIANTVTTPGIVIFGPFTLSQSSNPLPVELLSFTAAVNEQKQVDVNWVTASEQNSDYFSVERSGDGKNFTTIEKVKAAGNSTSVLNYMITDKNPLPGISYYRLKQTDFNGKFSYSSTRIVDLNEIKSMTVNVFPSPAGSTVYFALNVDADPSAKYKIKLFDTTGKLLSEKDYSCNMDPANHLVKLVRNHIASGIYYLKVIDESGTLYNGKILFQ